MNGLIKLLQFILSIILKVDSSHSLDFLNASLTFFILFESSNRNDLPKYEVLDILDNA